MANANNEMDQFFTSEKIEDGIKLPLTTPDGRDTEHFLILRGADSKAYLIGFNKLKRSIVLNSDLKDASEQVIAEEQIKMEFQNIALFVRDWSFDQPCHFNNVCAFLDKAPHIKSDIEILVNDKANFFKQLYQSS